MKKRTLIAASALLVWHKPIIQTVLLPAHAQLSGLPDIDIAGVRSDASGNYSSIALFTCGVPDEGVIEVVITLRDGSTESFKQPRSGSGSAPPGLIVSIADMVRLDVVYTDNRGTVRDAMGEAGIVATSSDSAPIFLPECTSIS